MIRTKEDLRRYMEADKRMLERGGESSRSRGLRLEVRAVAASVGVLAQPAKDAPHRVLGQVPLATAGAYGGSARVLNPAQRLRQRAQHCARCPHRRQPLCAHRQKLQDPRGREHRHAGWRTQ